MPRAASLAALVESTNADLVGIERGPSGPVAPKPPVARASATCFVAKPNGSLVLVHQGQRVPPDLADAPRVPAVWSEADQCWRVGAPEPAEATEPEQDQEHEPEDVPAAPKPKRARRTRPAPEDGERW
jgi:hypothetical protein